MMTRSNEWQRLVVEIVQVNTNNFIGPKHFSYTFARMNDEGNKKHLHKQQ